MSCRCYAHNGLVRSPEGLAQRDPVGPELAGTVAARYLDKVGSVSALVEVEDPIFDHELLDQQYRRFLSGS